jgi:hypothetical protein
MSDDETPRLKLPFMAEGQLKKHVTFNEALGLLDALVQLAVLERDLTAPPASPAEGQGWIVAASPTGAWSGHAGDLALWQEGAWLFLAPEVGWVALVIDEGRLVYWTGDAWAAIAGAAALQNLAMLGVGTEADSTNAISATLNNALFAAKTTADGGTGDLRYKLSKEAGANTLSFLFQDNFSGRAEIGLVGDDDFSFKVSADGTNFQTALKIDRTDATVAFPNPAILPAATSTAPSLRMPHGTAPATPTDGDVWTTSGGLFARVGGVTGQVDSRVLLTRAELSGTSVAQFLTKIDDRFSHYEFVGSLVTPDDIFSRVSVDGGTSWVDEGYRYSGFFISSAAGEVTSTYSNTGAAQLYLTSADDPDPGSFVYRIINPAQSGVAKIGDVTSFAPDATALWYETTIVQFVGAGSDPINAVEFYPNSGTMTGFINMYGVR